MTVKFKTGPGGTEIIVRRHPHRDATPNQRSEAGLGGSLSSLTREVALPQSANLSLEQEEPDGLRRVVEKIRAEIRERGLLASISGEARLAEALSRRQQFWIETCREPADSKVKWKAAAELRRKYGWRLCTPTPEQVQFVLDLLDGAYANWERETPALFFDHLETHFPHLARYGRRVRP